MSRWLSLLPSRMNSPSSQPFFIAEVFQCLNHLSGPLLDPLRCGLSSRDMLTAADLLALFLRMQPRIALASLWK